MIIAGEQFRSIRYDRAADTVNIIDQTRLPHEFKIISLDNLDAACQAIVSMQVRGAPLIGVTAAYGMYLALRQNPERVSEAGERLLATRPTAVNLQWALDRCRLAVAGVETSARAAKALETAQLIEQEDIAVCEAIGEQGAAILADLWRRQQATRDVLNILTHCNAGALATVDWGTALAVIYKAAAREIPLHVWVGETRPRNQGAALTCWELARQDIAHTLTVDSAAGLLMQRGQVDVCVVGSDRTTINGDACNKIGTYPKALAARDNDVPFYVALPISSIDFAIEDAVGEIPIEQRDGEEVSHISGLDAGGVLRRVRTAPPGVAISNYGFDVTPARLVSGLITERGLFAAHRDALKQLLD